jgi:hypothetical protein
MLHLDYRRELITQRPVKTFVNVVGIDQTARDVQPLWNQKPEWWIDIRKKTGGKTYADQQLDVLQQKEMDNSGKYTVPLDNLSPQIRPYFPKRFGRTA